MLKNVASNWVQMLVTVAVIYVLTPFVIGVLGPEGYGVWLLIASLTAYVALLEGGLPAATVRYVAEQVESGDWEKSNAIVASSLLLYIIVAAVALIGGGVLFLVLELGYDVPQSWKVQARLAYAIATVTLAFSLTKNLWYTIMEAHDDYVSRNKVLIGSALLRLVLTLVLLEIEASIVLLALVLLICPIFEMALSIRIVKRAFPNIRITLKHYDWRIVRRLFRFGVVLFVFMMGNQIAYKTDALVIGAFRPYSDIAFYSVANSLSLQLSMLIAAIGGPILPRATRLKAANQLEDLKKLFLMWSKVALSIALMIGLFLAVLGPEFLGWWIDSSFQESGGPVLQLLVISTIILLPIHNVGLRVLMGVGDPKRLAVAFFFAAVLNLCLSLALVGPMGIVGVALGTAIPNVLFAVFVLPISCRVVNVTVRRFISYVVKRALIGAIPVTGLLLFFKLALHTTGFWGLLVAGLTMLALFSAIWIFFVYRDDPYYDLRAAIVARWKRRVRKANGSNEGP